MKVRIIQENGKIKRCHRCGHDIFRKSTKSKYTNKQKTEGITYELLICDNCNFREQFNEIKWKIGGGKCDS